MRNHCFKHIFLEEKLYQYIYREQQYNFIEKLVEKIEVFYLNSLKRGKSYSNIIRSVQGKNIYKIRYSPSERLPFKIYENDDLELCLILGNIQNHEEGIKLHQREYKFTESQELIENDLTNTEDIFLSPYEYEFSYIGRIWSQEEEQRLQQNVKAELLRVLNKAQQSFLEQSGPILLRGTAGSGKTTVSIYRLLKSSTINKIYVTYTSGLKEYAKQIFNSLTVGLELNPIEFITVEELLLSIIAGSHSFTPSQKMTFEIFKSLSFIEKAVQQHKIEPYIIWEEIRGVLKQCSKNGSIPFWQKINNNKLYISKIFSKFH
ncbi:hypothetical protein ACN4EE_00005 [Geminocystis sp. CENA526]|uniref:hypothetical protein n=1 Tax=Geminocystis sp. CENA526 TaxID=1355871 RepID=UPI003D6F221F